MMLGGCAHFEFAPDFVYREIETEEFRLASWQKITDERAPYKIYIEGDGFAFNAHGRPTGDPTPRGELVRRLAQKDRAANVVYLARPCQYVRTARCEAKYWTDARFAVEVIAAEYQAIKQITKGRPVVLIGFSGGAQVAGLLAVTTDLKVIEVITIAGNLDHRAWTKYHKLPELKSSLTLADFRDEFMKIPQKHYVGGKDKVVPPELSREFVRDEAELVVVPEATHSSGW